jgi:FKBP-type peptidyl-prolyl cis-trans isomerase FkpA
MHTVRATSLAVVLGLLSLAVSAMAADVELKTDDEKTLYALGLAMAPQLSSFSLTPSELTIVEAGLTDGLSNGPKKLELNDYRPKIQQLAQARAAAVAAVEKQASQAFLTKAAAEKGAKKTESGLVYIELTPGTGEQPKATDKVKVHYKGTLMDGTVFDSSIERGQPATFPLNGVIKCWTEGVQLMKAGGKSKLICPSDIAYGDRGSPPKIKPGAALVFEVELLEIVK